MKKLIFVLHVENGGDLIQFVQDYFGISFMEALKKINYDFDLNLNFKSISVSKLKKLEQQQRAKKMEQQFKKENYRKKMLYLCNTSRILKKAREDIKSQLNPYNWEEIEEIYTILTEQIELLDWEFEELNVKQY